MPEDYANIRELLPVEGLRIMMVTQQDEIEWLCGEPAFFCLHLDNGSTIRVVVVEDGRIFYESDH